MSNEIVKYNNDLNKISTRQWSAVEMDIFFSIVAKVKNKDLAPLFLKVHNISLGFKKITFTHVPREKNSIADGLANQAMDRMSN